MRAAIRNRELAAGTEWLEENIKVMLQLLTAGAGPNATNNRGETPLSLAEPGYAPGIAVLREGKRASPWLPPELAFGNPDFFWIYSANADLTARLYGFDGLLRRSHMHLEYGRSDEELAAHSRPLPTPAPKGVRWLART